MIAYHDPVANSWEFGLKLQYDIGLVSPIWLLWIDNICNLFWISCVLAVLDAVGKSTIRRASSSLAFALGKE